MFQCFPKAEAGADKKTETSIKLSWKKPHLWCSGLTVDMKWIFKTSGLCYRPRVYQETLRNTSVLLLRVYIYDYIVYIYILYLIYICVYICIEYLKWSLYNDLNMLVLPNGLKSLTGPVGYRPERGQQCIGHERWEKIRRRWFDMIQM